MRDPATWLYPPIEPFLVDRVRVSPVHELYVEHCGNPNGKPVVFLHGGPGAHISPKHRQLFDPARYRIVLFDQRGCGKSTPHADITENTTWTLVDDIETLRTRAGIERWQVFGGSWGSTLALAYAQKHPERVTELVLRGIFLGTKRETDWLYEESNLKRFFPEGWNDFIQPVPVAERGDMLRAYQRLVFSSGDDTVRLEAARAWTVWETLLSNLVTSRAQLEEARDEKDAIASAVMEIHYFVNGCFLRSDEQLLEDVHKVRHIPATIVQGRYDVVCPFETAWRLHEAWPEADLRVIGDAGHSAFETNITRALVAATDLYAHR